MQFEFWTLDGTLCATGYAKGGAVSKRGIVETRATFSEINQVFEQQDLPAAVMSWRDSERQLLPAKANSLQQVTGDI